VTTSLSRLHVGWGSLGSRDDPGARTGDIRLLASSAGSDIERGEPLAIEPFDQIGDSRATP